MKKLRILSLVLVFAMVFLSLVACSGSKDKLIMATNAKFQPFEFVVSADKGLFKTFDGVDVAIGMEIAKAMDREFDIKDMEFDSILMAISNGEADMAIAGMSITEERKLSVDFSEPYCVAVQTILVPKDNTSINGIADLTDKKVGVVLGYTGDFYISEYEGMNADNIKRYKSGVDAVLELNGGAIDAVIIDSPTADAFLMKNENLKGISDPYFETEEYGIAVKKGNTELLNKINEVIKSLKESGQIDKWIEEVVGRM